MSLYPDENNSFEEEKDKSPELNQETEESTIFSAPAQHKDARKGSNMIRNSILAIVILAVVVSTALSVWIYVPKPDDSVETSSSSKVDESPLWELNSDNFSTISLTKGEDSLVFYSKEVETTSSQEDTSSEEAAKKEWLIKDVDNSLISTLRTGDFVFAVCFIEYIKVMEDPNADYGFNSPSYVVKLDGVNPADSKVLTVGASTADASSMYVKTSDSDSVYLVNSKSFDLFSTDPLNFADTSGLPPLSKDPDYKGEYFSQGALQTFDKIVVKSSSLSSSITITPNRGETSFGLYMITSPGKRYAHTDNVTLLFNIFANGLSGTGVYSFDNAAKEQRRFGLANPDFEATIYVDKDVRSFKAKLQTDGNYAVVGDGLDVILKVEPKNLSVATFGDVSFYSNFLFIESLTEIDTIKFSQGSLNHTFSVTPEFSTNAAGGEEKNIKNIKINGKEIDTKNFQDFYENLLWIAAVEFNFIDTSSLKADATIHITHNDGTKDTLIKYFKVSDMRYQMEVNGEKMGIISSSSFKNIFRHADNVANGKAYNS